MLGVSLWLFSFLFFTSIGLLLMNKIMNKKMVIYRRVEPFLTSNRNVTAVDEEDIRNRPLYDRLIQPLFMRIRLFASGRMPKHKTEQVERKLQAAGRPFGLSAGDFVLLQIALPIALFTIFTFLFYFTTEEKLKVVLFALSVATFSYVYTNYYLAAKGKERTKLIEKSMPDFFDMLNLSIEAGMGLDGALKRVCQQMETPLSEEFLSALEDMKLGKTRKHAFSDLRERVPSPFFKSVMSSIIQADQMGIGMSRVLRTQTKRIREKQRFTAREQAMKAPVKMLIPMVLFIFPTLFIVLIGPVVVNLVIQFM
jgi:tight adherence protein C